MDEETEHGEFVAKYNDVKEALLASSEHGAQLHAKLWEAVNYAALHGEGPPEDRP